MCILSIIIQQWRGMIQDHVMVKASASVFTFKRESHISPGRYLKYLPLSDSSCLKFFSLYHNGVILDIVVVRRMLTEYRFPTILQRSMFSPKSFYFSRNVHLTLRKRNCCVIEYLYIVWILCLETPRGRRGVSTLKWPSSLNCSVHFRMANA